MVREITQKHVAALAALGVAEEKAETALLSAQKLKPARAFSEDEEPEPEPESPEPTTPQLRFAKARSDARDDLHAARVAAEAARATRNADREALAAARKKLWALVGVLADADAELEASQRNPDGLGVFYDEHSRHPAQWASTSLQNASTRRARRRPTPTRSWRPLIRKATTRASSTRAATRAGPWMKVSRRSTRRCASRGRARPARTRRRGAWSGSLLKLTACASGCGVPLTLLRGSRRWRQGAARR